MIVSGLDSRVFTLTARVKDPRTLRGQRCQFLSKKCRYDPTRQPRTTARAINQSSPLVMQELPSKQGLSYNDQSDVKHLIVMANGLYGQASNWDVVIDNLRQVLDTSETLLAASNANSLKQVGLGQRVCLTKQLYLHQAVITVQTFDGIDSCGESLAVEIRAKAQEYPSLRKISFIGHSMGGLLIRFAADPSSGLLCTRPNRHCTCHAHPACKLYDPATRLICGLKPAHFITMATPHMGCDGEGPAQVPFIGWTGDVPLVGSSLQKLLQSAAKPFVSAFMKRTGQQFFMHDTEAGQAPLLVRMTEDTPEQGFFLSGLDSFVTRTCYGNAGGDHLVGWANSSIRHPDQLPEIDSRAQRIGVIREDPLQAAMHPQAAYTYLQQHESDTASSSTCPTSNHHDSRDNSRSLAQPADSASLRQADDAEASAHDGANQPHSAADADGLQGKPNNREEHQQEAAEQTVESSRNALLILRRLQTLPWRRIDVSFEGTNMSFFAHNHIQVTRKWLNWYGAAVCQHLAQQLAIMEKDASIQHLIESAKPL